MAALPPAALSGEGRLVDLSAEIIHAAAENERAPVWPTAALQELAAALVPSDYLSTQLPATEASSVVVAIFALASTCGATGVDTPPAAWRVVEAVCHPRGGASVEHVAAALVADAQRRSPPLHPLRTALAGGAPPALTCALIAADPAAASVADARGCLALHTAVSKRHYEAVESLAAAYPPAAAVPMPAGAHSDASGALPGRLPLHAAVSLGAPPHVLRALFLAHPAAAEAMLASLLSERPRPIRELAAACEALTELTRAADSAVLGRLCTTLWSLLRAVGAAAAAVGGPLVDSVRAPWDAACAALVARGGVRPLVARLEASSAERLVGYFAAFVASGSLSVAGHMLKDWGQWACGGDVAAPTPALGPERPRTPSGGGPHVAEALAAAGLTDFLFDVLRQPGSYGDNATGDARRLLGIIYTSADPATAVSARAAASRRSPDGSLPLHTTLQRFDVSDRLIIDVLSAYPEAAAVPAPSAAGGRLPLIELLHRDYGCRAPAALYDALLAAHTPSAAHLSDTRLCVHNAVGGRPSFERNAVVRALLRIHALWATVRDAAGRLPLHHACGWAAQSLGYVPQVVLDVADDGDEAGGGPEAPAEDDEWFARGPVGLPSDGLPGVSPWLTAGGDAENQGGAGGDAGVLDLLRGQWMAQHLPPPAPAHQQLLDVPSMPPPSFSCGEEAGAAAEVALRIAGFSMRRQPSPPPLPDHELAALVEQLAVLLVAAPWTARVRGAAGMLPDLPLLWARRSAATRGVVSALGNHPDRRGRSVEEALALRLSRPEEVHFQHALDRFFAGLRSAVRVEQRRCAWLRRGRLACAVARRGTLARK